MIQGAGPPFLICKMTAHQKWTAHCTSDPLEFFQWMWLQKTSLSSSSYIKPLYWWIKVCGSQGLSCTIKVDWLAAHFSKQNLLLLHSSRSLGELLHSSININPKWLPLGSWSLCGGGLLTMGLKSNFQKPIFNLCSVSWSSVSTDVRTHMCLLCGEVKEEWR